MDRNEIEERIKMMEDAAARGLLTSDELEDLWFKRMILEMAGPGVDVPKIKPVYKAEPEKISYEEITTAISAIPNWGNNTIAWNLTTDSIPIPTPPRQSEVMTRAEFEEANMRRIWEGRDAVIMDSWVDNQTQERMVEVAYNV